RGFWLRLEARAQCQEVAPGEALLGRLPQQIGGMQRRKERNRGTVLGAGLAPFSPERQNALGGPAQSLGRGAAEARDGPGARQADGGRDRGQAHQGFCLRRLAVSGRSPENQIGDENAAQRLGGAACKADRGQHFVEKLTGPSDEWLPGQVLLASRRLADEQQ